MKYYIIRDLQGKFLGFTTDKQTLEDFIKQRKGKKYDIIIKKKEKLDERILNILSKCNEELVYNSGVILFPFEEEYFIEGLTQYFLDFYSAIDDLKELLPFIKLDKDEEKNIDGALNLMKYYAEQSDDRYYDEELLDQDQYLNLPKMLHHIIDQF